MDLSLGAFVEMGHQLRRTGGFSDRLLEDPLISQNLDIPLFYLLFVPP
jgi:hypothetical protein